jgi:2'-5' RNA ligase
MKFQSLDNWLYEDIAKGRRPIDNQKRDYYGCLMLQAKVKDWEDYHTAGIDEEDIHIKPHDKSFGLETEPHVSVVFGLHEDQVDEETMQSVMKQNLRPFTSRVDEVDVFEGDEYDVVKYNIPMSDELQKYRDLFMKFPNTQTHKDYLPHMTIAYVKPGMGKKYKRKLREPFDVTFTNGVYSFHENPDNPEEFSTRKVNLEQDYDEEGKIIKTIKPDES